MAPEGNAAKDLKSGNDLKGTRLYRIGQTCFLIKCTVELISPKSDTPDLVRLQTNPLSSDGFASL